MLENESGAADWPGGSVEVFEGAVGSLSGAVDGPERVAVGTVFVVQGYLATS